MIDYVSFITVAAKTAAVPPLLLLSVCFTESSFQEKALVPHDGKSASYGLCQVKLATARLYEPGISKRDLMDPYTNALIAGKHLRALLERYDFNVRKAVDAYNRGRAKLTNGHSCYSDKVMKTLRSKPWNKKLHSRRS